MAHYTSQRAPDTFMADLVQDPESPVARLFSAALANSKNTKVLQAWHPAGTSLTVSSRIAAALHCQ